MQQAIAQAEKARLLSPPNPWVGCVIVKDGKQIGQGYTQPPGREHAEVQALAIAKEQAQGADLYVTLEPCSHWGRTPPCCDAIIQAGIKRVIVAIQDPDNKVQGNGLQRLRAAGIEVRVGICEKEVSQQLAPYLFHRIHKKPYTILKTAISLDGRIAAEDSSSQWITNSEAREDAHRLRAFSQAVMVGAGTALADNPRLTVRNRSFTPHKPPLRVLCDANGKVSPEKALFDTQEAPTLVFTTKSCPSSHIEGWLQKGAEVEVIDKSAEGIDLDACLYALGQKGVLQLLVEGGSTLHSSFLKKGCFQELVVYIGNCLLGTTGLPCFSTIQVPTITKAPRLSLKDCTKIGESCRLCYEANQAI